MMFLYVAAGVVGGVGALRLILGRWPFFYPNARICECGVGIMEDGQTLCPSCIEKFAQHLKTSSFPVPRWSGVPLQPAWFGPLKVACWCVIAISAAAIAFSSISTWMERADHAAPQKIERETYPKPAQRHFEDLPDHCIVLFPDPDSKFKTCTVVRDNNNGTMTKAGTDTDECDLDTIVRLHHEIHIGDTESVGSHYNIPIQHILVNGPGAVQVGGSFMGESDFVNGTTKAQYEADLTDLWTNICAHLPCPVAP